jgi:hypothetical protein
MEHQFDTPDPRYPIGKFQPPDAITQPELDRAARTLAEHPARLRAAIAGLDDAQLDTPYRPAGWTVRQVIHHLADSHMNSFIRFKLALTEDNPTIKPYREGAWANTADSAGMPPEPSLALLEGLHGRWVALAASLRPEDFARTFVHPEREQAMALDLTLLIYAWHCHHHVAHITALRERMGWK